MSGTTLPLFEPGAFEALYQATNGLPRKLNRLAHYAMSAAALAKLRQITAEHVSAHDPHAAADVTVVMEPQTITELDHQSIKFADHTQKPLSIESRSPCQRRRYAAPPQSNLKNPPPGAENGASIG